MDTLVIRLITGEELLGKKLSETDDCVVLENIVIVHQAPSQNNADAATIYLYPFAQLSNSKKISIRKSVMVCSYEPIVELLNKYNSVFGSGIILSKSIA
jgi:hypothetical protein